MFTTTITIKQLFDYEYYYKATIFTTTNTIKKTTTYKTTLRVIRRLEGGEGFT